MPTFEFSSRFACPVEKLWAFHEREDALALLSGGFPPVRVLRQTGGLEPGSEKEILIGYWPLQVRWLALHRECEPGRRFTDLQVEGPFRHWQHEHLFAPEGEGSRLTDRVDFDFPGSAVMGWLVRWQLRRMFAARHAATRRHVEG